MNDGSYQPYNDNIGKTYEDGTRLIQDRMKEIGARMVVGGPGPVDTDSWQRKKPDADKYYNDNLGKLGDIAGKLAEERGLRVRRPTPADDGRDGQGQSGERRGLPRLRRRRRPPRRERPPGHGLHVSKSTRGRWGHRHHHRRHEGWRDGIRWATRSSRRRPAWSNSRARATLSASMAPKRTRAARAASCPSCPSTRI